NIDKSVGLLNLSRNHVKLDKAQCNALSHVHTLILDVNHLKEFPAELACMSSLEVLNVSDNRLTQVPESLLQVTNLTVGARRGVYIELTLVGLSKFCGIV
ncbi:hypothetical protein SARC_16753, partial [Sphaeroforma arctica JP610]